MRMFMNKRGAAKLTHRTQIDAEFKSLIPPIRPEERRELELSIQREGCRDPLLRWRGLLLDGHNRHSICTALGVPYRVLDIELEDRGAAKIWILKNQIARRNLAPYQKAQVALTLESVIAERDITVCQIVHVKMT